jgi:pyroglutamyl-peptidase
MTIVHRETDRHMPKLLITGFGPFPGAPQNPTGQLVKEMLKRGLDTSLRNESLISQTGKRDCAPERVRGKAARRLNAKSKKGNLFAKWYDTAGAAVEPVFGTLPTSWRRLEESRNMLLSRHEPDMALHLGYSSEARGAVIERRAFNQGCEHEDADGQAGDCGPLLADGAEELTSPFHAEPIREALRAEGLAASISDDPGRYLCNRLYYLSLAASLPALFVHMPALETPAGIIPANPAGVDEAANRIELAEAMRTVGIIAVQMAGQYAEMDATTTTL